MDEKCCKPFKPDDLMTLLQDKIDPALFSMFARYASDALGKVGSSAPRVTDAEGNPLIRWQDRYIEAEIPSGVSVLDLGCGDGSLLARLKTTKEVRGQGVELDEESVIKCIENNVPVIQKNLDAGLCCFADNVFDIVILEETLQTLKHPIYVLQEMLRVGKKIIVSFPNFAYWRVRLDLAVRGKMPITEWLPYKWFDTPNIHLCSLADFYNWTDEANVNVVKGYSLVEGKIREVCCEDNLYAEEVLLILEKK